MGWQRRFHEPIIANGRTLTTLHDAATYITESPEKTSRQPHWQTAVRELMMAAERGGILMLAEIAMKLAVSHRIGPHNQYLCRQKISQRA